MPPERRRMPFLQNRSRQGPFQRNAMRTSPRQFQQGVHQQNIFPRFRTRAMPMQERPAGRKAAMTKETRMRSRQRFTEAIEPEDRGPVSYTAPFIRPVRKKPDWFSFIGRIFDAIRDLFYSKERFREAQRLPPGSSATGLAKTGLERAKARMIARVEQKQGMQKARARVPIMNRQGIQRQPARQMQKTGRIKKAA